MRWPRGSGLLVHPTSFPGAYGVGDLGAGATRMLDFLQKSGQRFWQTLPLGPTGYGNSPYAALSAFAGNPLLISPERLREADLLTADDLAVAPDFPADHVDYGAVGPWKMALLHTSYARFTKHASAALRDEFAAYCAEQREWLDDFALFMALKDAHEQVMWTAWPERYAQRDPQALAEARRELADEIAFQQYAQFLFARQWADVRRAAHARDLAIIGDLAIFVAHDSADVWARPELFQLDDHGAPTVVAGVPPDYFSPTGQRWGNPLYRWDTLAATGYAWWIARTRQALTLADVIRLDHFRGFQAYWEIPASEETAVAGRWVEGPGATLFEAFRVALGDVPIIAEDLGEITPEVHALRKALGFPGMRVLQFAFGGDANNQHLPHTYDHNSVVYTGTHDNDTTVGWFTAASNHERAYALAYLGLSTQASALEVAWAMLRAAYASVSQLALAPLQDALTLGGAARMNLPARAHDNWEWRCQEAQLTPELAARLKALAATYGR